MWLNKVLCLLINILKWQHIFWQWFWQNSWKSGGSMGRCFDKISWNLVAVYWNMFTVTFPTEFSDRHAFASGNYIYSTLVAFELWFVFIYKSNTYQAQQLVVARHFLDFTSFPYVVLLTILNWYMLIVRDRRLHSHHPQV